MAKAELDPSWWKAHAPAAIAAGAVQTALSEVSKLEDNLEKSGNPASYFKALDQLKAAIDQTAGKAKDAASQAVLAALKAAHGEGKTKIEGHLKMKGDGTIKGLSGQSGVAVAAAVKGKTHA